ncbi:MAG TPA: hypothetical protein VGD45_23035 [Steroidobacter sp.]|uniref:hypothetical protein n=1 Tax=Steroidobacter sp. TaxID=1978227 RepID=UPI002ED80AAF
MSHLAPHMDWLNRRSRHRLVAIAIFALLAWMLEIATHSHLNDTAGANPVQSIHCQLCSGFQTGAGPIASAASIEWLAEAAPAPLQPELSRSANTTSPYRSRAPPRA